MKKLPIIIAAALFSTVAHARDIHVSSASVTPIHTDKAFSHVFVGDEGLLTVSAVSDMDLLITAHRPDGVLVDSSDIVILDDQAREVETVHVEVSPFAQPTSTIAIIRWPGHGNSATTYYRCGVPTGCVNAGNGRSRANPDSSSVTHWSDGSSSTTETWHK